MTKSYIFHNTLFLFENDSLGENTNKLWKPCPPYPFPPFKGLLPFQNAERHSPLRSLSPPLLLPPNFRQKTASCILPRGSYKDPCRILFALLEVRPSQFMGNRPETFSSYMPRHTILGTGMKGILEQRGGKVLRRSLSTSPISLSPCECVWSVQIGPPTEPEKGYYTRINGGGFNEGEGKRGPI